MPRESGQPQEMVPRSERRGIITPQRPLSRVRDLYGDMSISNNRQEAYKGKICPQKVWRKEKNVKTDYY